MFCEEEIELFDGDGERVEVVGVGAKVGESVEVVVG